MRRAVIEHPLGHLTWGLRLRYWSLFAAAYPDACYRYDVQSYLLLKSLRPYWKADALASSTPYFRALMQGDPYTVVEWFRRALLGDVSAAGTLRDWRHELRERSHWDCEVDDLASQAILMVLVSTSVRVEFPNHVPSCFDCHRQFFEDPVPPYSTIDVTDDEQLFRQDDLNCDGDPFLYDPEYSGAYAVSVRGEGEEDVDARRAFWLAWLDDLLPRVQGTAAELRRSLETP